MTEKIDIVYETLEDAYAIQDVLKRWLYDDVVFRHGDICFKNSMGHEVRIRPGYTLQTRDGFLYVKNRGQVWWKSVKQRLHHHNIIEYCKEQIAWAEGFKNDQNIKEFLDNDIVKNLHLQVVDNHIKIHKACINLCERAKENSSDIELINEILEQLIEKAHEL